MSHNSDGTDFQAEYLYRYRERLALLCLDQAPNEEQERIAQREAWQAAEAVKRSECSQ